MTPRYGLVVTDGIAGRVFMLVVQTMRLPFSSDSDLIWDAVRINTPDGPSTTRVEPARVYLAPGEFDEVRA